MLKKYPRRKLKSSRYNKRILRSDGKRFNFKLGSRAHFFKSAGIFLSLTLITLLIGYYIYNISVVWAVKSHCSGCSITFAPSNDVENTLFVIESPDDGSVIGSWLVTNNKQSGKMLVSFIPGGVYINDYTKTLDTYIQTSNIKYVGGLINQNKPTQYELWELLNTYGVQISNYVIVTPSSYTAYTKIDGDLKADNISDMSLYTSQPSNAELLFNTFLDKYNVIASFLKFNNWKTFVENLDTNLSQPELISLLNQIKSKMSNGSVDLIDMSQDSYTTQYMDSKLDRQIPVLSLNQLDQSLNQYIDTLAPRSVSSELAKVEIYNASTLNGLAYRYARKLGNSGINVIRFENSPKNYDTTTIYVPNPGSFKNSIDMLEKILGGKFNVVNARPDFITTGDIILILGNDRSNDNGNF